MFLNFSYPPVSLSLGGNTLGNNGLFVTPKLFDLNALNQKEFGEEQQAMLLSQQQQQQAGKKEVLNKYRSTFDKITGQIQQTNGSNFVSFISYPYSNGGENFNVAKQLNYYKMK